MQRNETSSFPIPIDLLSCYDEDKKTLDLSFQDATVQDLEDYIIPFLKQHPEITTLDLSNNRLGNKGLRKLAWSLSDHPGLTALNLSNNFDECKNDDRSTYVLFFAQLKDRSGHSLKSLKLSNCRLTDAEMQSIGVDFPNLYELDVSHNDVNHEGFIALGEKPHLIKLNASHTKFSSMTLYRLRLQLPFLTDLDVSDTGIHINKQYGRVGLEQLLIMPYLSRLNISHNNLGDLGAEILSFSKDKKPFTHLNVSQCELSDKGIAALAASPHLITFDFSKNNITLQGAKVILEFKAIAPSQRISYAKQYAENLSTIEEKKEIEKACEKIFSLKNLTIYHANERIPGFAGCGLWLRAYDEKQHLSLQEDRESARKNHTPLLYQMISGASSRYFLYGDPDGNNENWQVMELPLTNLDWKYLFTDSPQPIIDGFKEIKPNDPLLTNELIAQLFIGHYHLLPVANKLADIYLGEISLKEYSSEYADYMIEKIQKGYEQKTGSLNLSSQGLTDQDVIDFVLPFLKKHPEIRILNLSNNPIGAESISLLTDYLHDKNLTALHLNHINVPLYSKHKFARFLTDIGRIKSLIELEIADNDLPTGTIKTLLPYFRELKSLNISGNTLNDDDFKSVIHYQSLTKLKMSNCCLGDSLNDFCKMPDLIELDVSNNNIQKIHSLQQKLPALKTLILNDNPLYSYSYLSLLEERNLTTLHVARCGLDRHEILRLATSPQFIYVDINGNKITYDCVIDLINKNPLSIRTYLPQLCNETHFSEEEKQKLQLYYAVKTGNIEMLEALTQNQPHLLSLNLQKYNSYSKPPYCTPLYLAIENGQTEIVNYLLDHGVNPHDYHDLDLAIGEKHAAIAVALIEKSSLDKISIPYSPEGRMVTFRWAFDHGYMKTVNYLLKKGFFGDFNATQPMDPNNPNSLSFIDHAAKSGNLEMVKALIENTQKSYKYKDTLFIPKDMNSPSPLQSALLLAAENNHADVSLYLLEQLLERDACSKEEHFCIAVEEGKLNEIQVLIKDFITNALKNLSLVLQKFAATNNPNVNTEHFKKACDQLIKQKLSRLLDLTKKYNMSPLMLAAAFCHPEIVVYLLELGANPNLAFEENSIYAKKTALHFAYGNVHNYDPEKRQKYLAIIAALIQHGADATQRIDPKNPNSPSFIQDAATRAKSGNLDIFKALVEKNPMFANKDLNLPPYPHTDVEEETRVSLEKKPLEKTPLIQSGSHQLAVNYLLQPERTLPLDVDVSLDKTPLVGIGIPHEQVIKDVQYQKKAQNLPSILNADISLEKTQAVKSSAHQERVNYLLQYQNLINLDTCYNQIAEHLSHPSMIFLLDIAAIKSSVKAINEKHLIPLPEIQHKIKWIEQQLSLIENMQSRYNEAQNTGEIIRGYLSSKGPEYILSHTASNNKNQLIKRKDILFDAIISEQSHLKLWNAIKEQNDLLGEELQQIKTNYTQLCANFDLPQKENYLPKGGKIQDDYINQNKLISTHIKESKKRITALEKEHAHTETNIAKLDHIKRLKKRNLYNLQFEDNSLEKRDFENVYDNKGKFGMMRAHVLASPYFKALKEHSQKHKRVQISLYVAAITHAENLKELLNAIDSDPRIAKPDAIYTNVQGMGPKLKKEDFYSMRQNTGFGQYFGCFSQNTSTSNELALALKADLVQYIEQTFSIDILRDPSKEKPFNPL